MWLPKFKLITRKQNKKLTSSVTPATFQVLRSHMWPVTDWPAQTQNIPIAAESSIAQPWCSRWLTTPRPSRVSEAGFPSLLRSRIQHSHLVGPHRATVGHAHAFACCLFSLLSFSAPSHYPASAIYSLSAPVTGSAWGWVCVPPLIVSPVSRKYLHGHIIVYLLND